MCCAAPVSNPTTSLHSAMPPSCPVRFSCRYMKLAKGMLSVFDCSRNEDGVYILDADPSIPCNVVRQRDPPRPGRGGEGAPHWLR